MPPPNDKIDLADALDAAAAASLPEPARKEETDLWWGGYASRTMLPSLLVCLLATGLLVLAAFLLVRYSGLDPASARAALYVLAGGLWIVQTLRWLYRVSGYTYRLTTRRIYCFWGFLRPKPPPIELADLSEVVVEQNALERLLRVGRIRLARKGCAALVLPGIANPADAADDIDRALRASQSIS